MQTTITEIAPDVFRFSTFVSNFDMQVHQFLVRDEEPLLWHTGLRAHFPLVRDAVATLIPIERLRWIGFSHFEADECGSLADWQRLAPHSTALASVIATVVSVDDSAALRPARGLGDDEIFTTGTYRLRFLQTPHVPHTWEAGMLVEETHATLFCSDLFHHNGNVAPTTSPTLWISSVRNLPKINKARSLFTCLGPPRRSAYSGAWRRCVRKP
ncbi:MAG: hypothetical protein ACREV1_01285 [Gammaproteobacteria bacterium]